MEFKRIIKSTFWTVSFPILASISLYDFFQKINPLESHLFFFACFLCVPMLILKTEEIQDETYNNLLNEFRQMTSLEFAQKEHEVMSLPCNRHAAMIKEAYTQVYHEKYNRDL